jgi:CBS domain-containing protein
MGLLRIAQSPLVTVRPATTVFEAVQTMDREGIGAVAVMDENRVVGIFSERDVMLRVVLGKCNPENTRISEVMTSSVETIGRDCSADDALKMMLEKHIRHLPVLDAAGSAVAMLSIRNLLHEKVEDLTDQLDSLEAYISADGAGG